MCIACVFSCYSARYAIVLALKSMLWFLAAHRTRKINQMKIKLKLCVLIVCCWCVYVCVYGGCALTHCVVVAVQATTEKQLIRQVRECVYVC